MAVEIQQYAKVSLERWFAWLNETAQHQSRFIWKWTPLGWALGYTPQSP